MVKSVNSGRITVENYWHITVLLHTSNSFVQVSVRIFCFSLTDFRPPFMEFEAWFTRDWATSQTKMGSSTNTSEKSCNERIIRGFNARLFTSKKDAYFMRWKRTVATLTETLLHSPGLDTYVWHNLPLWKVCVKIYFPQQKISFPKLKEAYFSLAIITNKKLWEPLSLKSMCSRSFFFLERVIIIQKGTSTSRRIM